MKKINLKNLVIVGSILIVGILGMKILGDAKPESQKKSINPTVRSVNTKVINFGNLQLEVEGNGVISSRNSLTVTSEVTGKINFAKNNLKDGTFVKKNEIIVKIDSREIENKLYSLRSDFMNALAGILPEFKVEDVELYKKWYNYFSNVDIHKNLPDLPKISSFQEKMKLSARQVFTKYYTVKNEEIILTKYTIVAPYSGYIKSNGVIENSFVTRGQHLFQIQDVYNLEIAVPLLVDEYNLIDFGRATRVEITSDNSSEILEGKIIRKDPLLNRNSQSLNVYISFSNYNMISEFLAGNYVNVKIFGKRLNNVAAIPRNLINLDSNVYTIDNGKLSKEKVNIIEIQQDNAIVSYDKAESLEIVTTILQKPLIGMAIQSINNIDKIVSPTSVQSVTID